MISKVTFVFFSFGLYRILSVYIGSLLKNQLFLLSSHSESENAQKNSTICGAKKHLNFSVVVMQVKSMLESRP
jgi:hypothetical protein